MALTLGALGKVLWQRVCHHTRRAAGSPAPPQLRAAALTAQGGAAGIAGHKGQAFDARWRLTQDFQGQQAAQGKASHRKTRWHPFEQARHPSGRLVQRVQVAHFNARHQPQRPTLAGKEPFVT
jgi:hypothetical protein